MGTKQTAVEFLLSELDISHLIAREKLTMAGEVVRQAKAMEKEQIKDAWKDSNYHRMSEDVLEYSSNEYYEETYGK